jgi:methylenetetrahydrofolate reductase (NADPH)
VERISFLAWKDEAFQLGTEWARCYDAGTPSRLVLDEIMDTWYLVNLGKKSLVLYPFGNSIADELIVNNDFHRGETIFEVLNGLEVPTLSKVPEPHTNGVTNGTTNGTTNGVEAST